MDREKVFYETPEMEIVPLEVLCSVLDSSLEASRSNYGEANVENWN